MATLGTCNSNSCFEDIFRVNKGFQGLVSVASCIYNRLKDALLPSAHRVTSPVEHAAIQLRRGTVHTVCSNIPQGRGTTQEKALN